MTWRVVAGPPEPPHAGAAGACAEGIARLLEGDEPGAEKAFDRALALSPRHLEATYDRAVLAWDQGLIADDEVIRRLQAVRESHLDSGLATWLLGLALAERRAPERARAAFEKAARLGFGVLPPEAPGRWRGDPSGRPPRCLRTFVGGSGVALAPGRDLAVAAHESTVRVLDLAALEVRATSREHEDAVECVAVHEGERALGFSGGLDRTVRVFDLETGKTLSVLEGHGRGVTCIAPSPDGRRLLTGSLDGTLRVFDLESGACVVTHTTPERRPTRAVAWNDEGAVSGGEDGLLRFWDFATGTHVATAHGGAVTAIALTGRSILSASLDGSVRVFNEAGKVVATHVAGEPLTALAADDDAPAAVVGTASGAVRTLDLEAGSWSVHLQLHSKTRSVTLSPGGDFALSCGEDGLVRVIELVRATGTPPLVMPRPDPAPEPPDEHAESGELEPADGRTLGADDWNNRGVALFGLGHEDDARAAWQKAIEAEPCHPEATYNLACHDWDRGAITDREVVRLLERANQGPSPSPRLVELLDLVQAERRGPSGSDRTTERPRCLRTFVREGYSVKAVAFSEDGKRAFSANGKVVVHDLVTGTSSPSDGPFTARPAVVELDTSRRLDLASGEWFEAHGPSTWLFVAPSPDGVRALSAARDRTVRLWDLADGECLKTWSFPQSIAQVAWTPDSKRAVVGGEDGVLRILDLSTGAELFSAQAEGAIDCLSMSEDGATCLVGGRSDRPDERHEKCLVHLWQIGRRARSFRPALARARSATDAAIEDRELARHLDAARAALEARDAHAVHVALSAARALPGHTRNPVARGLAMETARSLGLPLVGPRGAWPLRQIALRDARQLVLGPESLLLALQLPGQTLHQIDVATGHTTRTVSLTGRVRLVGNGRRALVGSAPTSIVGLTTGDALGALTGEPAALAPRGHFALTRNERRLSVWDVSERRVVARIESPIDPGAAALTPDGKLVLLGSSLDAALHVIEAATGRVVHRVPAYLWGIGQIEVSPDGRTAITAGAGLRVGGRSCSSRGLPDHGHGIRLLDLASGRWTRMFPDDGMGENGSLAFVPSHCGRWLLATGRASLRLIELASGAETKVGDLESPPSAVAWNGRYAACSSISEDQLHVFEMHWDFDPEAPRDTGSPPPTPRPGILDGLRRWLGG
jgi:WD40 repeat protein